MGSGLYWAPFYFSFMTKLSFIFLSILYVLISILSFCDIMPMDVQLMSCGALIALFGIPHGAIDNVIFLSDSKMHPVKFYAGYLASMALYLILWFFFPAFSFVIFLLVSAYHFGESQFSDYFDHTNITSALLYLIWGINILEGMILYNYQELVVLFTDYADLNPLLDIFSYTPHFYGLILSSTVLVIFFIYLIQKKIFKIENMLKEVYILALIHIAFATLPLLVGFTLYFVVLHSAKVLLDEFNFLKSKRIHSNFEIIDFIKLLLPFTMISFIGGGVILLLIENGLIEISYVLLSIIMISLITLPHSIVMNRFYNR